MGKVKSYLTEQEAGFLKKMRQLYPTGVSDSAEQAALKALVEHKELPVAHYSLEELDFDVFMKSNFGLPATTDVIDDEPTAAIMIDFI